MKSLEIGQVRIDYNRQGNVKDAQFVPTMKIKLDKSLKSQLQSVSNASTQIFKSNAEMVFSTWFAKMNEIELADREEYEVTSRVMKCDKYSDGKIKTCLLKFAFLKRK